MNCKSKIDHIYKYAPARETFVPMNAQERKEYRLAHPTSKEENFFRKVMQPALFCKAGDDLVIVSSNPGAWKGVVICENSKGWRTFMLWDDLLT